MFYVFLFMLFCRALASDSLKNSTFKTNANNGKINPFTLTKLDNESVKKKLDDFIMVRKKTHFTMPDTYGVPNLKSNSNENKSKVILSNPKINKHTGFVKNENIKINKHVKFEDTGLKNIQRFKNKMHRVPDHNNDLDKHSMTRELKSVEVSENSQNEKLFKVFTRQAELIGKLAKVIEYDEYLRQSKNDFEELLKSMEEKKEATIVMLDKDRNKTSESVKETTTVRLHTVMAMVDETAVREALKRDPYVKRILKIAANKREAYAKAAKQYYKL